MFGTTEGATFRVFNSLAANGRNVPGDVVMDGLADSAWAEYLLLALLVITQPTIQMGVTAAQLILDGPGMSQRQMLEPLIIVRVLTTVYENA